MIYFFSDDHYGKHCGRQLLDRLPEQLKAKISFFENDWQILESGSWVADCELLILNMIGSTCGQPHPGAGAEKAVKAYLMSKKPVLLLHGSSAAFWEWQWWRNNSVLRWVRPNDPDGIEKSTHPVRDYTVKVSKCRHALTEKLKEFTLPNDEIYINCEQMSPMVTLMETNTAEGTYPQCVEGINEFGGKMVIFLPGHAETSFENQDFTAVNTTLIEYLLKEDE